MQLRAALSTLLLTIGVAHAQSIDPVPPRLGPPPPAPPPPSGPATPAPDPSAPAAEPPPGAIAPPTDPDKLPADALPLAIAPAEPGSVVEPPYPRALVERPLVIPDGMIEAALSFAVARTEAIQDMTFTSLGVSPYVAYAVGRFALSAGAQVILDVAPDVAMFEGQSYEFEIQDEQRLAAAHASARFAPVPDLSLRLQLFGQALTTDAPRTTTSLVAAYKARISPVFAVVPFLAVGFSRTTYDDAIRGVLESRTALVASGGLAAQAQVAPLVAVVVRSTAYLRYEGAGDPFAQVLVAQPGVSIAHEHDVGFVASVTANIDVVAEASLRFSEAPTIAGLALGFVVRAP